LRHIQIRWTGIIPFDPRLIFQPTINADLSLILTKMKHLKTYEADLHPLSKDILDSMSTSNNFQLEKLHLRLFCSGVFRVEEVQEIYEALEQSASTSTAIQTINTLEISSDMTIDADKVIQVLRSFCSHVPNLAHLIINKTRLSPRSVVNFSNIITQNFTSLRTVQF
jgi:hypothetical protein